MPSSEFWLERWKSNQIGWNQDEVNPQLDPHLLPKLADDDELVFVPLCGKSLDMLWFAEQGCQVVGVDLSDLAAKQFFVELGLEFAIHDLGYAIAYRSEQIEILVGDIFSMPAEHFQDVTTVYDRGALVAMDPEQQSIYVARMHELVPSTARVMLLSVEYEGSMVGPPFSVPETKVRDWYSDVRQVHLLDTSTFDEQRFADRGAQGLTQRVFWMTPRL
jgi:thiopurine S-methyltransferase